MNDGSLKKRIDRRPYRDRYVVGNPRTRTSIHARTFINEYTGARGGDGGGAVVRPGVLGGLRVVPYRPLQGTDGYNTYIYVMDMYVYVCEGDGFLNKNYPPPPSTKKTV